MNTATLQQGNGKQPATAQPINACCPDCGQPLDYYVQQLHPKSERTPAWIGTCRTPECLLVNVTLSDDAWATTDLEPYRQMNRR